MKKKGILILALVLVAAAAAYVGVRLARRGTDIIGVTTLSDKNTVIMNAGTGSEFVSGSGFLTVGEGEHIHLAYDLSAGSIDVYYRYDDSAAAAYASADVEKLPDAEQMAGEDAVAVMDVSGKGDHDCETAAGSYTVYIVNNGAVGTAKVTSVK